MRYYRNYTRREGNKWRTGQNNIAIGFNAVIAGSDTIGRAIFEDVVPIPKLELADASKSCIKDYLGNSKGDFP